MNDLQLPVARTVARCRLQTPGKLLAGRAKIVVLRPIRQMFYRPANRSSIRITHSIRREFAGDLRCLRGRSSAVRSLYVPQDIKAIRRLSIGRVRSLRASPDFSKALMCCSVLLPLPFDPQLAPS
jgi:hypothetical protein